MKIAVAGTGYVGMSIATLLAQHNHVVAVDVIPEKVECRPVWKPMHKQPVYAGCDVYTNGVEEDIFKIGMCLPAGPYVSDEDVKYIVECIKEAII